MTSSTLSPSLVQTSTDRITIVADFPKASPEELFDYWTRPELLKVWWPPEAELRPEIGGRYHLSWPKQNWHLRGEFTEFNRGMSLAFTWKWDHEMVDVTQVRITFEHLPGRGTKLTLHHGNYPETAEGEKIRNEHVEGWMYFLGKLQEQTGRVV